MSASAEEIRKTVESLAERVLTFLAKDADQLKTAWDLKMEFKVTHTLLHLTLGSLLQQGKINLKPEKLTYAVELTDARPAPPAVSPKSGESHWPVAA